MWRHRREGSTAASAPSTAMEARQSQTLTGAPRFGSRDRAIFYERGPLSRAGLINQAKSNGPKHRPDACNGRVQKKIPSRGGGNNHHDRRVKCSGLRVRRHRLRRLHGSFIAAASLGRARFAPRAERFPACAADARSAPWEPLVEKGFGVNGAYLKCSGIVRHFLFCGHDDVE
jgi:hypothetical protein